MSKPKLQLATVLLILLGLPLCARALPYAYAGASAGASSDDQLTAGFSEAVATNGSDSASAEISLASGLMRGYARSNLAPGPAGRAAALVQGWDRFTLTGPAPGTEVELTISLHLKGSMDAIQTTFATGDSQAAIFVDLRRADQAVTPNVAAFQFGVHDSNEDPPEVEIDRIVSQTYRVLAEVPFGLSLYLHAWTQGTAISDFSHTAELSFDLPAGARIGSDAGFLQTAVPEPSSLLLLALLGSAARRARRPHPGHHTWLRSMSSRGCGSR
jgi:hypothetical protein